MQCVSTIFRKSRAALTNVYPWNLIFSSTRRCPNEDGMCTCHVLIRVESIRRSFFSRHLRTKPSKITVHIDVGFWRTLFDKSGTNSCSWFHFECHLITRTCDVSTKMMCDLNPAPWKKEKQMIYRQCMILKNFLISWCF